MMPLAESAAPHGELDRCYGPTVPGWIATMCITSHPPSTFHSPCFRSPHALLVPNTPATMRHNRYQMFRRRPRGRCCVRATQPGRWHSGVASLPHKAGWGKFLLRAKRYTALPHSLATWDVCSRNDGVIRTRHPLKREVKSPNRPKREGNIFASLRGKSVHSSSIHPESL